ncbi:unnamed protein product [Ceratitis capitata]|uniref:(Mediterranean fruit fly) hypothetical protein n=1 Tax=Ceratitis capitata TaxID=7213 RepID=A0A811V166_CERCA|nr:unnamed protein product [Ceratitis capitata]
MPDAEAAEPANTPNRIDNANNDWQPTSELFSAFVLLHLPSRYNITLGHGTLYAVSNYVAPRHATPRHSNECRSTSARR